MKQTPKQILKIIAEIHGKAISEEAAIYFLGTFENYPQEVVASALNKCARELTRFPTLVDVLTRIQASDGRPGVEEAWSMMPKCEDDTVVWTEEMAEAYNVVSSLIKEDLIAARMAFKEVYAKKVQDARSHNKPTKWVASLGHNKEMRKVVITEAVNKKRLEHDQAIKYIPDISNIDLSVKKLISGVFK